MAEEIKSLEELETLSDAAPVVEESAAPREPVRDDLGRSYATGKRKDAVARVWIKPGSGKVMVNGKELNVYFARPVLQMILRQPFQVAGVEDQFDVSKAAVFQVRLVRLSTGSQRRFSSMIHRSVRRLKPLAS